MNLNDWKAYVGIAIGAVVCVVVIVGGLRVTERYNDRRVLEREQAARNAPCVEQVYDLDKFFSVKCEHPQHFGTIVGHYYHCACEKPEAGK